MKRTKLFVIIAFIAALFGLLGAFSFRPLMIYIARLQARGAISKTVAIEDNCNGRDRICVMQKGEIVSKKQVLSASSSALTTQEHITYAINVAKAVAAIRAYTHVPNLDVSPLNNSVPTHITYYCTRDNKCWAVNNHTHQVIPGAKSNQ